MKAESYAPDRIDEVLVGTYVLELGAKVTDMHIEGIIFRQVFFSPYALKKISLGEDLIGVLQEKLQYLEFLSGE